MHWSIATVSVLGVLLGVFFRAPALLVATALTVLVTGFLFEGPVLIRVLVPVILLQCAYLVGLALAELWRRFAAGGR